MHCLSGEVYNCEVTVCLLQERDEWVTAIEQQILSSLQLNLSDKSKVCVAT